jgi:glycerol-3-phosphate dehydrogenase
MNFSTRNRQAFLQQLASQHFELLVIGGGITGCGIALDASLRGIKTALVEKADFASGTSSRSTKLIHGGLRYLKQLEFKLVKDVGSERAIVFRNARHVVIPEKMLLPIVEGGSLGKYSTSLGLWVYDVLAGVDSEEQRKMLTKEQTLASEPLLNDSKLLGGGLYYEYRTDDARLVIEMAKSANENGATLLNYLEVRSFVYDDKNKITGVKLHDRVSGTDIEIKADVIVNAAGPSVDLIRKEDNSLKGKRLQLTKGVHIVFPYSKLPLKQAVYFDVEDGRMIFAIPRNGVTYVGTTDTVYNREIDKPECNKEDADYLLKAVNNMFKGVNLTAADIESTWAGLRPLIYEEGKSPSELSRKDEIIISESGLVSIAGGKLTGYRLMAQKIVDIAIHKLGKKYKDSITKDYKLSGGSFNSQDDIDDYIDKLTGDSRYSFLPADVIKKWVFRYGSNTQQVMEYALNAQDKTTDIFKLSLSAELAYCIDHEMIVRLSDFIVRRTGMLFFERPATQPYIPFLNGQLKNELAYPENLELVSLRNAQEDFASATAFL